MKYQFVMADVELIFKFSSFGGKHFIEHAPSRALKWCLSSSEPAEEESSTEAVPPGVQAYRMLIRVTGLGEGFRPPAPATPAFEELREQLLPALRSQLQVDKGFYDLHLNGFSQYVPILLCFPLCYFSTKKSSEIPVEISVSTNVRINIPI